MAVKMEREIVINFASLHVCRTLSVCLPSVWSKLFVMLMYSTHETECDYKPVSCPNNPECPVMLKKVSLWFTLLYLLL